MAGSIGSVGDTLDNALIESVIALYKTELVDTHPGTWTGRAELERETAALDALVQHHPAALLDQLPATRRVRTALP